jgi:hypothetical protein
VNVNEGSGKDMEGDVCSPFKKIPEYIPERTDENHDNSSG